MEREREREREREKREISCVREKKVVTLKKLPFIIYSVSWIGRDKGNTGTILDPSLPLTPLPPLPV